MSERHSAVESVESEPPPSRVKSGLWVPAWAAAILIPVLITFLGGMLAGEQKLATAAAQIDAAVERISAIESRLNGLANLEARQAVLEAKVEADRQRLDRVEQRADTLEQRFTATTPR